MWKACFGRSRRPSHEAGDDSQRRLKLNARNHAHRAGADTSRSRERLEPEASDDRILQAEEAQRNELILAATPACFTIVCWEGHEALHQNFTSRRWLGNRVNRNANRNGSRNEQNSGRNPGDRLRQIGSGRRAPRTLPPASQKDGQQSEAPNNAVLDGDVLELIFRHEPDALVRMLQDLVREGDIWKGVVRVPAIINTSRSNSSEHPDSTSSDAVLEAHGAPAALTPALPAPKVPPAPKVSPLGPPVGVLPGASITAAAGSVGGGSVGTGLAPGPIDGPVALQHEGRMRRLLRCMSRGSSSAWEQLLMRDGSGWWSNGAAREGEAMMVRDKTAGSGFKRMGSTDAAEPGVSGGRGAGGVGGCGNQDESDPVPESVYDTFHTGTGTGTGTGVQLRRPGSTTPNRSHSPSQLPEMMRELLSEGGSGPQQAPQVQLRPPSLGWRFRAISGSTAAGRAGVSPPEPSPWSVAPAAPFQRGSRAASLKQLSEEPHDDTGPADASSSGGGGCSGGGGGRGGSGRGARKNEASGLMAYLQPEDCASRDGGSSHGVGGRYGSAGGTAALSAAAAAAAASGSRTGHKTSVDLFGISRMRDTNPLSTSTLTLSLARRAFMSTSQALEGESVGLETAASGLRGLHSDDTYPDTVATGGPAGGTRAPSREAGGVGLDAADRVRARRGRLRKVVSCYDKVSSTNPDGTDPRVGQTGTPPIAGHRRDSASTATTTTVALASVPGVRPASSVGVFGSRSGLPTGESGLYGSSARLLTFAAHLKSAPVETQRLVGMAAAAPPSVPSSGGSFNASRAAAAAATSDHNRPSTGAASGGDSGVDGAGGAPGIAAPRTASVPYMDICRAPRARSASVSHAHPRGASAPSQGRRFGVTRLLSMSPQQPEPEDPANRLLEARSGASSPPPPCGGVAASSAGGQVAPAVGRRAAGGGSGIYLTDPRTVAASVAAAAAAAAAAASGAGGGGGGGASEVTGELSGVHRREEDSLSCLLLLPGSSAGRLMHTCSSTVQGPGLNSSTNTLTTTLRLEPWFRAVTQQDSQRGLGAGSSAGHRSSVSFSTTNANSAFAGCTSPAMNTGNNSPAGQGSGSTSGYAAAGSLTLTPSRQQHIQQSAAGAGVTHSSAVASVGSKLLSAGGGGGGVASVWESAAAIASSGAGAGGGPVSGSPQPCSLLSSVSHAGLSLNANANLNLNCGPACLSGTSTPSASPGFGHPGWSSLAPSARAAPAGGGGAGANNLPSSVGSSSVQPQWQPQPQPHSYLQRYLAREQTRDHRCVPGGGAAELVGVIAAATAAGNDGGAGNLGPLPPSAGVPLAQPVSEASAASAGELLQRERSELPSADANSSAPSSAGTAAAAAAAKVLAAAAAPHFGAPAVSEPTASLQAVIRQRWSDAPPRRPPSSLPRPVPLPASPAPIPAAMPPLQSHPPSSPPPPPPSPLPSPQQERPQRQPSRFDVTRTANCAPVEGGGEAVGGVTAARRSQSQSQSQSQLFPQSRSQSRSQVPLFAAYGSSHGPAQDQQPHQQPLQLHHQHSQGLADGVIGMLRQALASQERVGGSRSRNSREECWHEIWAARAVDPVTRRDVIVLVQHDVTAKVIAERHLAAVMETEHRLLEQLFPRHILAYITEDFVAKVAAAAAGTISLADAHWRPTVRDCNALATWHPQITLLFADIKGFTPMCKEVEPSAVMAMLNDLYSRYDKMLDEYGVFKVETIGDCYFVAGGLVHEDEDGMASVRDGGGGRTDPHHADRVFGFAKAMVEAARQVLLPTTGQPVEIRIGIHSGPVVSGVVGTRMPRFCLFGDTVNTASRMESSGLPGAIHVSEATYSLLRDAADWSPTGGIVVKGKGVMPTYLHVPQPAPTGSTSANTLVRVSPHGPAGQSPQSGSGIGGSGASPPPAAPVGQTSQDAEAAAATEDAVQGSLALPLPRQVSGGSSCSSSVSRRPLQLDRVPSSALQLLPQPSPQPQPQPQREPASAASAAAAAGEASSALPCHHSSPVDDLAAAGGLRRGPFDPDSIGQPQAEVDALVMTLTALLKVDLVASNTASDPSLTANANAIATHIMATSGDAVTASVGAAGRVVQPHHAAAPSAAAPLAPSGAALVQSATVRMSDGGDASGIEGPSNPGEDNAGAVAAMVVASDGAAAVRPSFEGFPLASSVYSGDRSSTPPVTARVGALRGAIAAASFGVGLAGGADGEDGLLGAAVALLSQTDRNTLFGRTAAS